MRGKILVIRGGAIGDFILTLPAITALRQQFPEAHLEVVGYPHIVQLAEAGGLVNRVQAIEARALAGFGADFFAVGVRTRSSGTSAERITRSAMLPRAQRENPVRPCVPSAIRSTPRLTLRSRISEAGSPSTVSFETFRPA